METFRYIMSLAETKKRFPETSWVRISTITMTAKYPRDVDIQKFRAEFKPMLGWQSGEKPDKKFYNCIPIVTRDSYTTKNVKIFPNGSIHVTGCCDLADCARVAKKVSAVINAVLGLNEEIPAESINTCLIITNFCFNYVLNLETLIKHFKSDKTYQLEHNPDRYSGVRIKFTPLFREAKVTVTLFSSGKVLVATSGSIKVIAAAYKHINEKIEEIRAKEEPLEEKNQVQYPVFMGYTYDKWVEMLQRKGVTGF
jgi:TATA-box binding protein (TBP) (component of TFIID and TFIIIB)